MRQGCLLPQKSFTAHRVLRASFHASSIRCSTSPKSYRYEKPKTPQESRLTTYLKNSPASMTVFKLVTGLLGTNSPKQVAGRHTYRMYEDTCSSRDQELSEFWHEECRMPSTFQTWFTITNLHVWMLTVRFRALPERYGNHYVQGLVDHFFLDVEERIRRVLSHRVPERLVTHQMKVLREQWGGMNLSLDYALGLALHQTPPGSLNTGDAEMAAALWRNFLGARGAQGIDDPGLGKIRRAVNLTGEIGAAKLSKDNPEQSLQIIQTTDDGSGVYDFSGSDVILYAKFPQLMYAMVKYVRSELSRLEKVPDSTILNGGHLGSFGAISFEAAEDI